MRFSAQSPKSSVSARTGLPVVAIAIAAAGATVTSGSTAAAAGWITVATHHDSGPGAQTQVSADVHHPKALRIRVKTKGSSATAYWTETCGHKGGSKVKNGHFHVAKSATKIKRLPKIFANDIECNVQTQGSLKGSGTIVIAVQKLA